MVLNFQLEGYPDYFLHTITKGDQNRKKSKEWGYTVDNFSDKEFEATEMRTVVQPPQQRLSDMLFRRET